MNRYDTKEWKRLEEIQNTYYADTQDILTITGFMDDEEFIKHLEKYERLIKEAE